MENKKSSRDRLIEMSGDLFRMRGYHNTSIADIAEACNLRKASIYHHITSKKDLGMVVIKSLSKMFDDHFFCIAYDNSRSERERLYDFVIAIEKFFANREGGCLMGNLTLEVVDFIPEFKSLLQTFFNNWTNAFAHLFTPHYGQQEAWLVAQEAVAWTQGAIMLCRLYKSTTPLTRLRKRILNLLD